jgi:hypothetical protein
LRKIHKKQANFFLNKGGQRGSSGGGWLSSGPTQSKSSAASQHDFQNEKQQLTLKQKRKLKRS